MQVVIAVSQIMFCRDMTGCLSATQGNILDAVKNAEQRCFQVSYYITYTYIIIQEYIIMVI